MPKMSRTKPTSILWQRIDTAGHDACCIQQTAGGWCIEGMAVFQSNKKPARFVYQVICDDAWQTQRALIHGAVGDEELQADIVRSARGRWKLNGVPQPQLDGCDDLDIAFTPATNTIPIRKLSLRTADTAIVRAAWLNIEDNEFSVLEQSYTKVSRSEYAYHAPRFNFRAKLTVNASGIVTNYPKLWKTKP